MSTTSIATRLQITEAFVAEYQESTDLHIDVAALKVGDHWCQGDLIFWVLEELPEDVTPIETHSGQMAPGTSVGSRHVFDAESLLSMEFFKLKHPTALSGDIFRIAARTAVRLTHPEHRHQLITTGDRPAIIGCTFQRRHADTLAAQAD